MRFSVSAEYRIFSSAGIVILLHRLLPSLLEKIHGSRERIEFIGVEHGSGKQFPYGTPVAANNGGSDQSRVFT
jgi:hypothetical protein